MYCKPVPFVNTFLGTDTTNTVLVSTFLVLSVGEMTVGIHTSLRCKAPEMDLALAAGNCDVFYIFVGITTHRTKVSRTGPDIKQQQQQE